MKKCTVVGSIVQMNLQVARRHKALLQIRSPHSGPAVALVQLDHVEHFVVDHFNSSFTFGCFKKEIVGVRKEIEKKN